MTQNNALVPSNPPAGQLLLAPFSQEAEETLLGTVLVGGSRAYDRCAKIITSEDFYLTRHRYLWETFHRLHVREEPMDLTTIGTDLMQRKLIEDIGGPAYLLHLINEVPIDPQPEAYARIVVGTSNRRKMLVAIDKMREIAMDQNTPYEQGFALAQAELDKARPSEKTKHLRGEDSIPAYSDVIMQREAARLKGVALTLPLPETWYTMRERVGEFQWGDLVVLGGPTGSGKTAMAECLLEHYASQGHLCSYTHTEMTHLNLLDRRHARHSGLPYHLLITGDVTDGERGEKFVNAEDRIATFAPNIQYDWMPNVQMADLATHWRTLYDAGVRAFFLDHFQDVGFSEKMAQNIVQAREELAKWLAAFIEKRGDVIVFCLSQLNNEGEIKGGLKLKEKAIVALTFNRPLLTSDCRYTFGDDTETLLLPGEESPVGEVTIQKHRFGRRGKFRQFYHGPRFQSADMKAARMAYMPQTAAPTINLPKPQQKRAN